MAGLLIVEELPLDDPHQQTVVSTIVLTVLRSVVAHGISGRPPTADRVDAATGPLDH